MRSPKVHVPEVYMAGVPSSAVDRNGAVPEVPDSDRTLTMPRQIGSVAVGVRDGSAVRVDVRVGVPV